MDGELTIDQQMRVLTKIWGPDREGFVFLPWIPGNAKDKDERRKNYHEGPAFEWPKDKARIKQHLTEHTNDDVYFAPAIFFDRARREEFTATESLLWADMDESDPNAVESQYKPTVAWESSPGRYQAVWVLTGQLREGTSWQGNENQRLTTYIDADPSGWDSTQLLRVPGRPNWKPEYRSGNGGKAVPGKLLWDNGPRYRIEDFDDLPAVPQLVMEDTSTVDEAMIASIDRHDVWGRVRLKVARHVREFMAIRTQAQADDAGKDQPEGRSGVQWQIMRELADAGCTIPEIVAVVRPSVWNTFAGRRDELKRLINGAAKAIGATKAAATDDDGGALEELDTPKPEVEAFWLSHRMVAVPIGRPSWLVRNVWSKGGCGFIAGDPKSYKSWMGLDLAVSVATGTPFLGDPQFAVVGGPRPVIYIQEEDNEMVVRQRVERVVSGKAPHMHWHGYMERVGNQVMWAPPTRDIPLAFLVRTGFVASDPGWQVWLQELIQSTGGALVVIDTLGTTAGDVDTDRAQDLMNKILKPMKDITNTTGASIAVVHHNRKNSGDAQRGGARMLGSVALHAWVDDAMYVHSREQMKGGTTKVHVERESKSATEHRWVVEVPFMRDNPDGTRTVWEPATGLWDRAEAITGDDAPPTPRTTNGRPSQAGKRIVVVVKSAGGKDRPVTLDHLVEVMGSTKSSVRNQLKAAVENGFLTGDESTGYRVTD